MPLHSKRHQSSKYHLLRPGSLCIGGVSNCLIGIVSGEDIGLRKSHETVANRKRFLPQRLQWLGIPLKSSASNGSTVVVRFSLFSAAPLNNEV